MSKSAPLPAPFEPMLAFLEEEPFDSPDHLFDIKWDGVRALLHCDRSGTRIYSRSQRDITVQYPEFFNLHDRLKVENAVLDGEIISMTDAGRPSFEKLQGRIGLTRRSDIQNAVTQIPVDLMLFDVVFLNGNWINDSVLEDRLALLEASLDFEGDVLMSAPIPVHGEGLFEAAKNKGLEGIVAKRLGSKYVIGKRTRHWLKIKVVNQVSCVIAGWKAGEGNRSSHLGSLLLGLYEGEGLKYIGSVGTGFTAQTMAKLMEHLSPLVTDECSFVEKPNIKGVSWVRPKLVCIVDYREVTNSKKLRAPSFKGLRDDLDPSTLTIESELSGFSSS